MEHILAELAAFLAAMFASDLDLLQVLVAGSCGERFTKAAAFASLCPETQKDLDKLSSELEAFQVRLQVLPTSFATPGHAGRRARLWHSVGDDSSGCHWCSCGTTARTSPATCRGPETPTASRSWAAGVVALDRTGETAPLARKAGGDP